MRARVLKGEYISPDHSVLTFAEAWEVWRSGRLHKAGATVAQEESVGWSLILPHLGHYELRQVTPEVIRAWVSDLEASGRAPGTVAKALQKVRAMLQQRVDGGLTRNAARSVTPPRTRPMKHHRYLSMAELSSPGGCGPTPLPGAHPRRGVHRAADGGTVRADGQARRPPPATGDSREPAHRGTGGGQARPPQDRRPAQHDVKRRPGCRAGTAHGDLPAGRSRAPHLHRPLGGPVRRSRFRRHLKGAVADSIGDPFTFHDLRHTNVSLLVDQGESFKVIQHRLGHRSITMTIDKYGHLRPERDEEAADRLDDLFRRTTTHRLHRSSPSTGTPPPSRAPAAPYGTASPRFGGCQLSEPR